MQHGQAMPPQPWSVRRRVFSVVFMVCIISEGSKEIKRNHRSLSSVTLPFPRDWIVTLGVSLVSDWLAAYTAHAISRPRKMNSAVRLLLSCFMPPL